MSKAPFSFEKSEDSPGFLLWQTTVIWQRKIKRVLDPFDLSHTQFVLLANIMWFELHNEEITQALLVNNTKLDKMTVSKSLKNLTQMGLVERHEHSKDTRSKSVRLTEKGKEIISEVIPKVEVADEVYFNSISNYQRDSLIQIFRTLIARADHV